MKHLALTILAFVACSTFGEQVWKNLLDNPADWPTVNNYNNNVKIEFGVPVEGAKFALRVTGVAETNAASKDTAWSIRSKRVALPRSAAKFSFSYFVRADNSTVRTRGNATYSTAICWYDAAGNPLGRNGLMLGMRKGSFNRERLVDALPPGAAAFEVQLGIDVPDLAKDETVSFAGVTVSLLDETATSGEWGPDLDPPEVTLVSPKSPARCGVSGESAIPAVQLNVADASEVAWDRVKVSVDGEDKTAAISRSVNVVSLPAPETPWSEGIHTVSVVSEDTLGNVSTNRKKFLVGDAPSGTPRVTIRDDGVTLVDGEPFFPIGMYNVRPHPFNGNDLDRAVRELKDAGFNICHSYRYATDQRLLKAAEKYDMKFWFNTFGVGEEFVSEYRANRQMLAWYIGDDTSSTVSVSDFSDRDENVRALDPTRVTTQADGMYSYLPVDNYQRYAAHSDVYMPEIYPIYGRPADTACVAEVIRDMDRTFVDNRRFGGSRNHAVWPIIQNFKGWTAWKRYPTPEETTAMSFAALVHGAKGIVWYTYGATLEPPPEGRGDAGVADDPVAWNTATNVSRRIASLAPVLLSRGDARPSVTVLSGPALDACGQRSVSALLKRLDGTNYVIAVNATDRRVSARIALATTRFAEVRWEGRSVQIDGTGITDDFAPYGVHVYRWQGPEVTKEQERETSGETNQNSTAGGRRSRVRPGVR